MRLEPLVALALLVALASACEKEPTAKVSVDSEASATATAAIRTPDIPPSPSPLPSPATSPTVDVTPALSPPPKTAQATPVVTPTRRPWSEPPGAPELVPQADSGATEPPERDLFDLATRLRPHAERPIARVLNPEGTSYEAGHRHEFWVSDLVETRDYTVQATLKLVSEHAYWYVDDETDLGAKDLARAADAFESEILPLMRRYIGSIWDPGVDNDPRLTILHTPLRGVNGYYGSGDEYPSLIHPHSNEREIIYMDASRLTPGTPEYLGVLTHELQHAVHWNLDHGEDAWINEGMAEVAKELAGYPSAFVDVFLRGPDVQLNYWPDELGTGAPHYGAAALFLTYLSQHYGGFEKLRDLAMEPADGVRGVESLLSQSNTTFVDVFKDWVVANYVNAPDGPYGYDGRDLRVRKVRFMTAGSERQDTLPQFAAHYYDLRLDDGDANVRFQGETEVAQIGTSCHSGRYCWWSNRGDSIDSTLTREIDLTGLSRATLEFWTWFRVEKGWDYAYAEVSDDGGATWTILEGEHTTTHDPVGNSYGDGYSGSSDAWVREKIDLSPYAGGKVLVRFEYVTDDAVYLDGFAIDDIGVPEAGFYDDAEQADGWQAQGFARIDNVLLQEYAVQVITEGTDGHVTVRDIELDEEQRGQLSVRGFGSEVTRAVVVVAPVTRGTHQRAPYTLAVSLAK